MSVRSSWLSRISPSFAFLAMFLTAFTFVLPGLGQVYIGGVQSQVAGSWSGPVGVASDTSGNIYIAQYQYSSSVVKVDAKSHATSILISTSTSVCGNTLSYAQGLASDSSNNLYIADQGHNRVVVYNLGTSSCSAYYNVAVPFAIALDSSSNIWVTTDGSGAKVSEIPANSATGTTGTAVVTGLSSATGVAFDSAGNLYVSDRAANTVYKYTTPSTTPVQSPFLTSANGTSGPYGLMFDASGNLYVCEATTNQVLKYLAPGYTTSVQVSPDITHAEGVNRDPSGNVFLTAYVGNTVTEISSSTGDFGQVNVGSSQTLELNLDVASGTTIGSFQVVDQGLTTQEFNEPSPDTNSSLCATGYYGSTTSCAINVTFTPSYPGQRLGAVNVLDTSGTVLATAYLSGTGMAPLVGFSPGSPSVLSLTGLTTALNGPRRPVFDPAGNLYLIDLNNNRLIKVAPGGAATVVATPGYTLSGPNAVTLDGAGNLYIDNNSNVIKLTAAGTASQLSNSSLSVGLIGIAVDSSGNVYAADNANNRIIEYPVGGAAQVVAFSGVTLSGPAGVVVDGFGDLYVADAGNNRIVEITNGVGSVISLGSLTLSNPRALSIDSPGNLYICDSGNNRIVLVPAAGGAAVALSTGATTLDQPIGAAISGSGDLYIMDAANNRIVISSQTTAPSLTFTNTVQGSTSTDSPQGVTVLNLGNLDLSVASAAFTTSAPTTGTSFSSDATTTCTATIAANSSCIYDVDFIPAAGGANTGALTLTDNTLGNVGSTQTIALSGTAQALVSKLAFGQAPAQNVTAGGNAGSAITVSEEDSSGVTVTSQTDLITLIATGPNGYQQTYTATAVAGVATFNLSGTALNSSGVYTYTASAGSPTNAIATENVSAASASVISLSGGATSVTAGGNAGVVSATIVDTYGNPVTNYSGAVTYTLKNAAGATVASGTATASNGVAGINLAGTALTSAGSDTLTVNAAGAGSVSESIAVSAAAPSQITAYTGINTSATYTLGSTLGPITTTVVDSFGNIVTNASGAITYTLTLPDGTKTTGTATIVNGVVTLLNPAASLTQLGTYTLSLTGSGNYGAISGSTYSFSVVDFTLAVSGSGTQSVLPGGTAIYALTVAPAGAQTFPAVISLSVSGLPDGAVATLSPTSIPAGSGSTPLTLTIATTSTVALLHHYGPGASMALAAMLLPFGVRLRRRVIGQPRLLMVWALAALTLLGVTGLSGCGSSIGLFGQKPQTYTVVVTGTSGSLTHSTNVTLTVQ